MAHKQQQLAWRLTGEEAKLLTCLFKLICILSLCIYHIECDIDNNLNGLPVENYKSGPKDYAYSPVGSRVRDLASFFESMAREANGSDGSDNREEQNVIISLSEAASKLHILTSGYPLEFKCNKYVKLITRPNIRTFATINLLMKEARAFNEMEQNDANLVAKLANERSFDAMGKLQTIIQTLESERENMRSIFEPSVQRDLFDCMNYYIYRHQRSISGITYYAREQRDKLMPIIGHPVDSEILLRKLQESLDDTRRVEAEGLLSNDNNDVCNARWIDNLSQLHKLLMDNQPFEVPILVQKFVTDNERLSRLIKCNQMLDTVKDLQLKLVEIETATNGPPMISENREYKVALEELHNFSESNNELLRNETYDFVHEPNRWKILDDKPEQQQQQVEVSPQPLAGDSFEAIQDHVVYENPVEDLEIKVETAAENFDSKLNYDPADQQQKVVVAEEPSFSQDLANTEQENVCEKLYNQQEDNLRQTSWRKLEIDEALRLAENLNEFQVNCKNIVNSKPSENTNHSCRWAIISISIKLSSWCSNKLEEPSLVDDSDRTKLSRVLELIYGRQE